ncbi:MAG: putative membrane protein YeiH [Saprospiraceae bacterium]|jgi:uncharacterized membrane protein YeiH
MTLIYSLDLIGTFVFAISGTLAAAEKRFDIFGAAVLAFVTAVGGGTIRDLMIGNTPVGWMKDLNYLLCIGLAIPASYFFRSYIQRLRKTMFLFDTIGIALFTVLGVKTTLAIGLSPVIAVMMGTVSAVFGGVLRDVFSNEVPLIFRKEIYATACIIGGLCYLLILKTGLAEDWVIFLTVLIVIGIRILAVKKGLSLPKII